MPMNAPTSPKCEKCGEATELLSFIPRFGDRPAFHIFECPACGALAWVAQTVTGSEPQALGRLSWRRSCVAMSRGALSLRLASKSTMT
jgi:hypothetical protein